MPTIDDCEKVLDAGWAITLRRTAKRGLPRETYIACTDIDTDTSRLTCMAMGATLEEALYCLNNHVLSYIAKEKSKQNANRQRL